MTDYTALVADLREWVEHADPVWSITQRKLIRSADAIEALQAEVKRLTDSNRLLITAGQSYKRQFEQAEADAQHWKASVDLSVETSKIVPTKRYYDIHVYCVCSGCGNSNTRGRQDSIAHNKHNINCIWNADREKAKVKG